MVMRLPSLFSPDFSNLYHRPPAPQMTAVEEAPCALAYPAPGR